MTVGELYLSLHMLIGQGKADLPVVVKVSEGLTAPPGNTVNDEINFITEEVGDYCRFDPVNLAVLPDGLGPMILLE